MNECIIQYGWNEHWQARWGELPDEGLTPARVTGRWRGQWEVAYEGGLALAGITGRLRRDLPEDFFPEVGDFVGVRVESGTVLIAALLPRRATLQRHMAFSVSGRQVMAANVDVAFAAMALDRDYSPARLERYLVAIAEGGVKPVALLTKADLCPNVWGKVYGLMDQFPGVDVVPVSALTGEGLESVRTHLGQGRTAVVLGASGAGKSTLLNALFGEEILRTGGLRSDGVKGAHTTTNRQMVCLPDGTLFIDTPGMRELGVVGEGDGLTTAFADVEELAEGCRFRDCRHEREPGCAVQQAVAEGRLDPHRLKRYRSLQREMAREAEKAAYRLNHLSSSRRPDRARER